MFRNFLLLANVLGAICFIACSPPEEFPVRYKGEQLHFGQGGGFSGALNYFAILDDGRLFQRAPRDSTFALVDTWEKPFVKQMFANYKLLQLDTVKLYEPGDLYYFIEFRTGGTVARPITWGKPGSIPDKNIVTYYNLLYKSTKSKS